MPHWKVTRRAKKIGACEPKPYPPERKWSNKEIRLLQRFARYSPETIRRKMLMFGFKRSTTAILLKKKRLRLAKNLEGYSASQVALGFGIDSHCVTRWIREGYLKATRRGTDRTEKQGGDMWWVEEADLRNFIIRNLSLIDFRKVEKYWIVDILIKDQTKKGREVEIA
jgi:hypothetical protein